VTDRAKRDRVLVVDDAANLRELLTLLLETEDDFEVIGTASDGEQALTVAETLQPDIVLLDLAMPIMDGMQALPGLRGLLPGAIIVIFSGFEQAGLVDEAMAAGADAYLEKGASVTQLVDLLRELRDRRGREATT
jgi:DNA-binding NarL/FixJ family response regulator